MKQVIHTSDISSIEKKLYAHPFVLPKSLQNYNIQTLLARFGTYFKTAIPKAERRYIILPDGSQIAADCMFQPNKKIHPTVIVLDGFTRPNNSHFSRSICYKAYHFGFNVILLMQRAEGDTIHLTKSLFSAYPQLDLPIALEEFSKMGLRKMYLVGFSAGGWSTLLTLGTMGENAKKYFSGVALISSPCNLLDTWNHIEKYPLYNRYLLHSYKKTVKRRGKVDSPGTWNLSTIRKIKTKKQFFETFFSTHTIGTPTKRVTVEEYNQLTNATPLLPNIQVPTLIIHAHDDPVTPVTPFLHITNQNILTLFSKHGGHGGFFTTKKLYGDLDGHWAQNRVMEFIRLLDGG